MKKPPSVLLLGFASFSFTFGAIFAPAPTHGQALIIEANAADRVLLSTNGATGTSLGNVASTLAQVGETGTDNNQSRYYLPFGLLTPEQSAAILNAPSQPNAITLNLFLGTKTNIVGFNIDVYGFPNRADTQIGAFDAYYQFSTGVTLLHEAAVTPETPTGWVTLDITNHAKTIVGAEENNRILAYRFQMSPSSLPNSDELSNRYQFQTVENTSSTPYIEIIPEPSTYALGLGVGILGFVWVWRRFHG